MRRIFHKALILTFVVLLFSYCSVPLTPEDILACSQQILAEGTELEWSITVSEGTADVVMFWSPQEQSLQFTAPEAVAGLRFLRSASGLEVSKDGLSQRLKAGQLLRSAVAEKLFAALDEVSACDGKNLSMDGDVLLLDGVEADVFMDVDGSITKILWENGEAKRKQ